MRSLLPHLRELFFYFQCLPCCKPSARSDTSPLLDNEGNPREEQETILPFGDQVCANVAQDSSPRNVYALSPDNPSNERTKTCTMS
ncbi:MAG: hypothetical protein KBD23_01535 [Gammaproteobacteria bacterium]|nr:hypothetical protein [Gammaproteobacteria bacterium]MBP9728810.1 hypothetical protein [Gammaproteobacteria bacterium]